MKQRFRQPLETGPLVTLKHNDYVLKLAPMFGARIVSFRHGALDILRPTPDVVLAEPKVYGFACFPLMPYSGPLFGQGFTIAGSMYRLDRTVREEPTATHGDAWISPFRIVARDEAQTDIGDGS